MWGLLGLAVACGTDTPFVGALDSGALDGAVGDFEPPEGRLDGVDATHPGAARLVLATSVDGLVYERVGRVVTDQGNVPDLVVDDSGRLFLYYTGGTVGERENATAVAISEDDGENWTFYYVDIEGEGESFVDPDVVLLDDGTFRLYYTASVTSGSVGIAMAEGTDGRHFSRVGAVLSGDTAIIDSTTLRIGGAWHLMCLGGVHATSIDGISFEREADLSFESLDQVVVSNPIPGLVPFTLMGFSLEDQQFRSYMGDGWDWSLTDTIHLEHSPDDGLEYGFIKDPTIARLSGGDYLMVYVTEIAP